MKYNDFCGLIVELMVIMTIMPQCLISQNLVVSTGEVQMVYEKIENPLNTNLTCFDNEKVLITDNGDITVINDTIYWKPLFRERESYLKLGEIQKSDTIIFDSIKFQVCFLGLPEIELNRKEKHSGLGDYLESNKLIFSFNEESKITHLYWRKKIRIEGFKMKVAVLNNATEETKNYIFKSEDNTLPQEFHLLKKGLRVDDILVIELEEIKINCEWQPDIVYYDEVWVGLPFLKIKWTWRVDREWEGN